MPIAEFHIPKTKIEKMGKATILSGGTDGLYKINYHVDRTRIQAQIDAITLKIEDYETGLIPAYETDVAAKQAALNARQADLNAAIAADADPRTATAAVMTAGAAHTQAINALDTAKMELTAIKFRKVQLEQILPPASYETSAWCADHNEDLSGDVGVLEIPGERAVTPVIIKPAGEDGTLAAYIQHEDGIMVPVLGISPEIFFYNLAMFPAWQKWMPGYRLGTITSINTTDGDLCSVTLDSAASTQQGLNINKTTFLTNVPIVYMSCNGAAFEEGDRIVIKYTGSGPGTEYTPTVWGFESEPKCCPGVILTSAMIIPILRNPGIAVDRDTLYVNWQSVNNNFTDLYSRSAMSSPETPPQSIPRIGRFSTPVAGKSVRGIAVDNKSDVGLNNFIYLATRYGINIHDNTSPFALAKQYLGIPLPVNDNTNRWWVGDVVVDDNFIYGIGWSSADADNIVKKFNITSPYAQVGTINGFSSNPGVNVGIAIDDNNLYITDGGTSDLIRVYNKSTFALVGTFGIQGTEDDELVAPPWITVDNNHILVVNGNVSDEKIVLYKKASPFDFVKKIATLHRRDIGTDVSPVLKDIEAGFNIPQGKALVVNDTINLNGVMQICL